MKCGRCVFHDHSRDSVRTYGLMDQGTSERRLHYGRYDSAQNHRNRGGRGWSGMVEPRKYNPWRESGIREDSRDFLLRDFLQPPQPGSSPRSLWTPLALETSLICSSGPTTSSSTSSDPGGTPRARGCRFNRPWAPCLTSRNLSLRRYLTQSSRQKRAPLATSFFRGTTIEAARHPNRSCD